MAWKPRPLFSNLHRKILHYSGHFITCIRSIDQRIGTVMAVNRLKSLFHATRIFALEATVLVIVCSFLADE